jgi:hypothetical protein
MNNINQDEKIECKMKKQQCGGPKSKKLDNDKLMKLQSLFPFFTMKSCIWHL